jgi:hypothetical protein
VRRQQLFAFLRLSLIAENQNVDAVSLLSETRFLLSTSTSETLFGFSFDDGDVVVVNPGEMTAGLYLGLDEALLFTGANQDIDALHYDRFGRTLLFSIRNDGIGTAAGVSYDLDSDLFAGLVAFPLAGPATGGTVFLNGIGLYDRATRQLDAAFLDNATRDLPVLGPTGFCLLAATLGLLGAACIRSASAGS